MGDRGNIVVHEECYVKNNGKEKTDKSIFLYTHWGGYRIKQDVQEVLSRKQRWDDAPYLTRMLFCKMVGKERFDEETGYGISTYMCDNEHNLIHVYPDKAVVEERTEKDKLVKKWTFDEYIKEKFKEEEE